MTTPEYKFTVLDESGYTEGKGWKHKCGAELMGKTAYLTIRDGLFPLSGNGDVETVEIPYCPNCEEPPKSHGTTYPDGTVDHPSFVKIS